MYNEIVIWSQLEAGALICPYGRRESSCLPKSTSAVHVWPASSADVARP